MCAENVANAMEFAWTCRISYGKPLDCLPFICWLEMSIAILSKLSEMAGYGKETQIILVTAMMVAGVMRPASLQSGVPRRRNHFPGLRNRFLKSLEKML